MYIDYKERKRHFQRDCENIILDMERKRKLQQGKFGENICEKKETVISDVCHVEEINEQL